MQKQIFAVVDNFSTKSVERKDFILLISLKIEHFQAIRWITPTTYSDIVIKW